MRLSCGEKIRNFAASSEEGYEYTQPHTHARTPDHTNHSLR